VPDASQNGFRLKARGIQRCAARRVSLGGIVWSAAPWITCTSVVLVLAEIGIGGRRPRKCYECAHRPSTRGYCIQRYEGALGNADDRDPIELRLETSAAHFPPNGFVER
jgi:hypothetical protein